METTVKKREWVTDAAIIFLAVLLVLTFFSNTIMNRSLPEVATAPVTNGNIVAKVRGSGTVAANGKHQVKAKETRTIRSVMIKAGQEVNAGEIGLAFAMATVYMIPSLLLFLHGEEYLVEGIANSGSVKG